MLKRFIETCVQMIENVTIEKRIFYSIRLVSFWDVVHVVILRYKADGLSKQ